MPKQFLIEEFHLSFFAGRRVAGKEVRAARRFLGSAAFRRKLRSLIAAAVRDATPLRRITFELSV
jgi:hypothetical protein